MAIIVENLNGLNKAMSLKRVFGRISPRYENGRVMDVEAKLVLRTDEEIIKLSEFVASLKDKD